LTFLFYQIILVDVKDVLMRLIKDIRFVRIATVFLLSIFFIFGSTMQAQNEIITFVCSEWPPFEYMEDDTLKGIDVKIIKEAFLISGIEIAIKILPWNRCINEVKKQTVDGVFSLRKTLEREQYLLFPEQVLDQSINVLFYSVDKPYYFNGDYNSLKGLIIGTTLGYDYGENFMTSNIFQKEATSSDELNFNKLINHRINLFICDKIVGLYILNKYKIVDKVSYNEFPVSIFDMYIAFTKNDNGYRLSEIFNKGIKQLKKSGRYNQIISEGK